VLLRSPTLKRRRSCPIGIDEPPRYLVAKSEHNSEMPEGPPSSRNPSQKGLLGYWYPYTTGTIARITSTSSRALFGGIEIEIEIVYNMCRQTGPTAVSRATLLCHAGLISKLAPGLFDQVHLSTHLASLCVDVPRELKIVSNRSNCHSPQPKQ
jgi:hypothetical protein